MRYALVVTGVGLALLAPPRAGLSVAAGADRTPGVFEGLAGPLERLARSRPRIYASEEFVTNWVVRDPGRPGMIPVPFGPEDERGPGVLLHRSQGIIQFRPNLAPAEVERLLETLPAAYFLDPIDASPRLGMVVVKLRDNAPRPELDLQPDALERLDEDQQAALRDVRAVQAALARVRQQPWAEVAVQDLLIGVAIVPEESDGTALAPDHQFLTWAWDPRAQRDGNWGLKRMNFPAAWNFNDAIRRRWGEVPTAGLVEVGIIDVGFGGHVDLPPYGAPWFAHSPITAMLEAEHGNHVAGIVAASWNTLGVDGCAPFSSITACTVADLSFKQGKNSRYITAVLSQVLHAVEDFLFNHPRVKVVNLSLGYGWVENEGLDPTDPEVRRTVEYFGRLAWAAAQLAETQGILIVSAAGNDSGTLAQPADAQWSSPFNWAAVNSNGIGPPMRNVIVVEAVDRKGRRCAFSNIRGSLAAPGEDVLSLGTPGRRACAVMSGTSMAAPHVTGLIAMMYAYNPELKPADVLKILGVYDPKARPAATVPAPVVDAFEAMVACRKDAFQDLADLTRDGRVDSDDFKVFKRHLRQVEKMIGHEDLNGDGAVDADENFYPRADLNGSGRLSRDPTDAQAIRTPGDVEGTQPRPKLSDLGVMMEAWQDRFVSKWDLETMLDLPD